MHHGRLDPNPAARGRSDRMTKGSAILMSLILAATVGGAAAARMAESAEETTPLGPGGPVPDVTLETADGDAFDLRSEVAKQPTVLIFYRGGWCPYCMTHLQDVRKAEGDLRDLGYRILAISADPPSALRPTVAKEELGYTLLSDHAMQASAPFGLAFALDDATVAKYRGYGIELTARHEGRFWLPIPAVYVVGKDGRIAYAHTDPDYTKRLAAEDIVRAAREAAK